MKLLSFPLITSFLALNFANLAACDSHSGKLEAEPVRLKSQKTRLFDPSAEGVKEELEQADYELSACEHRFNYTLKFSEFPALDPRERPALDLTPCNLAHLRRILYDPVKAPRLFEGLRTKRELDNLAAALTPKDLTELKTELGKPVPTGSYMPLLLEREHLAGGGIGLRDARFKAAQDYHHCVTSMAPKRSELLRCRREFAEKVNAVLAAPEPKD